MSRTYTDTPEPRYVERAKYADNAGSDLPEPTIADEGKVLGVNDEGKYALVEGGGGSEGGIPIMNIVTTALNSKVATTVENYSDAMPIILAKHPDGALQILLLTETNTVRLEEEQIPPNLCYYDNDGVEHSYTKTSAYLFGTTANGKWLEYDLAQTEFKSLSSIDQPLIIDLEDGTALYMSDK